MADPGLKIVIGADISAVTDGLKVASKNVADFGSAAAHAFDEVAASAAAMDRVAALVDKLAAEALGAGQQLENAFRQPIKSIAQLEAEIESLEKEMSTSTDFASLKRLNEELKRTQAELRNLKVVAFEGTFNKLNPAAAGAAKSITKVKDASKAGSAVLTDFNRVIQDSAFGFVSIQNNITEIPRSFRVLSEAAKESGQSVGKVLLSTLMGPAGIGTALSVLTSALTFASVGFGAWTRGFTNSSKAAKDASAALDEYNKLLQSVSQEVGQSASRITTLVNALQSDTLNTAQRRKALDELKQQNQEFFGALNEEKGIITGLQAAYDGYLERIKAIATAKAIEAQLTKLFDKRLELELNIDPKFNAAVSPTIQRQIGRLQTELNKLGGAVEIGANQNLRELNDNLRKRLELQGRIAQLRSANIVDLSGTREQIKLLDLQIAGLTNLQKITGNFSITGKDGKKETDTLKTQLDLLEKLRDAAKEFQGKLFDLKEITAATDALANLEQQVGDLKLKIAVRDAKKAGLPPAEIERLKEAIKIDTQNRLNEAFEKEALLLELSPKLKSSRIDRFDIADIAGRVFTNKDKIKILLGEKGVEVQVKQIPVDITDLQGKIAKATGLDKKIPTITLHEARIKILGVKLTEKVEFQEKIRKELNESFSEALKNLKIEGVSSIAESLGEALSGGDLKNVFKSLFSVIASGLQQFGKALIAYGVAQKAFQLATKSLNPALAIAAGSGLIIAGAALKASLPKFAEGGIVSGPVIGQIGERYRPEVILPLDRLPQLFKQFGGDTGSGMQLIPIINNEGLYLAMKRGERSAGRKF
jgi:hypothetical protein